MEEHTQQIRKPEYRTALVKQPTVSGSGIYAITLGAKVLYVGSSKNMRQRLNHHRHSLLKGTHKNTLLVSFYCDYSDLMDFEVIEYTSDLINREIYYIRLLNPECNLTAPNEDGKLVPGELTRKRMSNAKKNFVPWNVGIPRSEETKRKISATKRGLNYV